MEYSGTWREIWTQKGQMEGGIEDLYIYDGWEKSKGDIKATAERITEALQIKPSDRVLEVGCGAGALAQYMNCAYVGIEYSCTLLQKHVEFFGNDVLYAEANDLPFRDKWFDKAFSWGVFLYFDSLEYARQAVRELERVTRSGILIGELPMESHDEKHLLYPKALFEGWNLEDAWTQQYKGKRFIARKREERR